jgi:hypothetical protein
MNILTESDRGQEQKWIGLARVKPRPGNDDLGEAVGAFVGVIALAKGIEDYDQKVTDALNEEGFEVLEIEDIQTLEERRQAHSFSPELLQRAESVNENNPVAIGTFHCYVKTEESEE